MEIESSNPQTIAHLEIAVFSENIASWYAEQLFHPTLNIHVFLIQVYLTSPGDNRLNINLLELNLICV